MPTAALSEEYASDKLESGIDEVVHDGAYVR